MKTYSHIYEKYTGEYIVTVDLDDSCSYGPCGGCGACTMAQAIYGFNGNIIIIELEETIEPPSNCLTKKDYNWMKEGF